MLSNFSLQPALGVAPRPEVPERTDFFPSSVLSRLIGGQEALHGQASVQMNEELASLSLERDSKLFFEGLLAFGVRQEQAGHLELAARVYTVLGDTADSALRQRAHERLQAVLGQGSLGPRAEFLLRRLAQESCEPASLLAMGSAGALFKVARLGVLSRLVASPTANLLTRGFGARALASLAAFGMEAPAFTLTGHLANTALGRNQDWSHLGSELASSYLVLGGMRLTGWAANSAGVGLRARPLQLQLLNQTAMLSGILLGHRLEEGFGLREHRDGVTTLIDSLALLLQFNVAGNLTRHAFGERFHAWEQALEFQTEQMGQNSGPRHELLSGSGNTLAYPALAAGTAHGFNVESSRHPARELQLMATKSEEGSLLAEGSAASGPTSSVSPRVTRIDPLRLPRMGLRPKDGGTSNLDQLNREEAARRLCHLMPNGRVDPQDVDRAEFVSELLHSFGVSDHAFDRGAFRRGFDIAQRNPERIARLAFDIDEVYLHWSLSPADLFRGALGQGVEALYRNTAPDLLNYQPFETAEGVKLSWWERLWYHGIQQLLPTRMRQHIQLHPGVRAFQLGLRLGQNENLIMATTGPSGRILRLANEDPAMKMIYFGKIPTDLVSIQEVRDGINIYTREDLVLAMRQLARGELNYFEDPLVAGYLEMVRQFPDGGVKLKHPAISRLLGKRPFTALVDDSATTFTMLGNLPGFVILQPPSARPARTLNFVLASTRRYLDRMKNGYVEELAEILDAAGPLKSQQLSPQRSAPNDYPLQRFAIEIPWAKFGAEFVKPARELRALGKTLARGQMKPVSEPGDPSKASLSLTPAQTERLLARLYREFELSLGERLGEVSLEANHTHMYRDLAQNAPEDFQAFLDQYFTSYEQTQLPQASRPLAGRGQKYYSRIASVLAVKKAVCNLLAMDPAEHSREIHFRFGRPSLSGEAATRLGSGQLMTTLADDGELGIGAAILEPSTWDSGLVGIGLDLTTDRVQYTTPGQHGLAIAAYRATYSGHSVGSFNHYRAQEIVRRPDGGFELTGKTMQAARDLRGDQGNSQSLPIQALSFRIGNATASFVAVPSMTPGKTMQRTSRSSWGPGSLEREPTPGKFPYLRLPDGGYELPSPGMVVAVLGDVAATRTLNLARRGHHPIHIERDLENADYVTDLLKSHETEAQAKNSDLAPYNATIIRGDWYETQAQADLVEAYYPLSLGDLPPHEDPARFTALQDFLSRAMNSKIREGGSGFIVSEISEIIDDLARVVREDPKLELLEFKLMQYHPPLKGGFGAVPTPNQLDSWLVYRKRPGPDPS